MIDVTKYYIGDTMLYIDNTLAKCMVCGVVKFDSFCTERWDFSFIACISTCQRVNFGVGV